MRRSGNRCPRRIDSQVCGGHGVSCKAEGEGRIEDYDCASEIECGIRLVEGAVESCGGGTSTNQRVHRNQTVALSNAGRTWTKLR